MIKERSYDEVKAKYQEFVKEFLSGEEDTEKMELFPNFWSVVNKKHDFHATINCEYRVKDLQTLEKEWVAVVTDLDSNGKEKDKSNFLLEFEE